MDEKEDEVALDGVLGDLVEERLECSDDAGSEDDNHHEDQDESRDGESPEENGETSTHALLRWGNLRV